MAFEGSYTDRFGTDHSSAYAIVDSVYVSDSTKEIKIRVELYSSKTAFDNGNDPLDIVSHDYSDDTIYDSFADKSVSDVSQDGDTLKDLIKRMAYQLIVEEEDRWEGWSQV